MDQVIVAVAKYGVLLVALGAGYTWLRAGRRDRVAMIVAGAVALLLVWAGISLAAHLWVDPRPFVVDGRPPLFPHPADNGFPSDHTTLGVAVAVTVAGWRRALGAALVVVALLVGLARVAAHVHHLGDVLGGGLIGAACAVAGITAAAAWSRRTRARGTAEVRG